ncbi:hypothetical protein GZ051_25895 [Klebsiella oxytoca]|uniref:hypothetical protein n=1 Tax=Klebsiella oxytoca TaxID=571 RepID=UPI00190E7BCF|nr:hypothetical protein [Klebsiella oxytoca]MBK0678642.1 hypothetical protein [Klebsiella oxytoca]
MNADFVADYLADYKYLFYLFCLAVLVYRYITVGRKYPLFRKHQQSPEYLAKTSYSLSDDDRRVRHSDISDMRSNEYHYYMKRTEEIFSPDDK